MTAQYVLPGAKRLISGFIVMMLLMAITPAPAAAQQPHTTLSIAISNDFHPFTFVNESGEPAGMFVDIWRLWSRKTGRPVQFVVSDWQTSVENVKSGRVDLHSGLVFTPERAKWMQDGNQPLYAADIHFMYPRHPGQVSGMGELSGKTVAVLEGSVPEEFLVSNFPKIRLLSVPARRDLLSATREGTARGFFIVGPVGSSLIDHAGLSGDYEKSGPILSREDFHPGLLKKNLELASFVNNGLALITPTEMAEIEALWVQSPALQRLQLVRKVALKWVGITAAAGLIIFAAASYGLRRAHQAKLKQKDAEFALREHIAKERHQEELAVIREQVEHEERSRFARELHDGSGQSLQAIRLHLKLLAAKCASGEGGDIAPELNRLAADVGATAGELRDIAHMLRPSFLHDVTLDKAIAVSCGQKRRRGVPVSFSFAGEFPDLPFSVSDNIYRIFQEAVANAARHSGADRIDVELTRTGAALRLVVTDDGCGLGGSDSGEGIGLKIMAERAALIGATLSVSSEGKGTTVTMILEGV